MMTMVDGTPLFGPRPREGVMPMGLMTELVKLAAALVALAREIAKGKSEKSESHGRDESGR